MRKEIPPVATGYRGLEFWLEIVYMAVAAIEQTIRKNSGFTDLAFYTLGRLVPATKSLFSSMSVSRRESVNRLPHNIRRLARTGYTLVRISLSYRFWLYRAKWLGQNERSSALDAIHLKNAQLFAATSLEHGGAFLKVGQILSARSDVLPPAWVEELEVLQDHAAPVDAETVGRLLLAAYGAPPEQVFASFEEEPIAAASIGQVHRAVLHSGEEVAVKIRRPGIEALIKLDMFLMKAFLKSLASFLPETDLVTISAEVERAVLSELDYRNEAAAMKRVGAFLNRLDGVAVPAVFDELTRESVLVSAFIRGRKITEELNSMTADGRHAELSDLLGRLLDIYLHQVLREGEFQADPHPGNVLVTPDGALVLLDFGCTMQLDDQFRRGYLRILFASIRGQRKKVARELARLGFKTRSGRPDTLLAFSEALLKNISRLAAGMGEDDMDWPDKNEMLAQAKDLMHRSKDDPVTTIPAEFVMLARVFSTLGGLFMHYQPAIDVDRYLWPHLADNGNPLLTIGVMKLYIKIKKRLLPGRFAALRLYVSCRQPVQPFT